MANKKISELDSRASLDLGDLLAVGDPSTGYLYKTTISDLKTLTGAGVVSFNGRYGSVVPVEGDYSLTQLSDVIITSPSNGQILQYNGSNWVNTAGSNFALDSTVVHLAGTETITGVKTFTANTIVNGGKLLVGTATDSGYTFDVYGSSTGSFRVKPSAIASASYFFVVEQNNGTKPFQINGGGTVNMYAATNVMLNTIFNSGADRGAITVNASATGSANGLVQISGDVGSSGAVLVVKNTGSTLPNVFDVRNSSNASLFTVSNGGTITVAGDILIKGGSGTTNSLMFEQSDAFALPSGSISKIDAITTAFSFGIGMGSTNYKYFILEAQNLTNNTQRTYYLPDATGTIALTSNLSSYVPYTGATGTLTMGTNNVEVGGASSTNYVRVQSQLGYGFIAEAAGSKTLLDPNGVVLTDKQFGGSLTLSLRPGNLTTGNNFTVTIPGVSGTALVAPTITSNNILKVSSALTGSMVASQIYDDGTTVGIGTSVTSGNKLVAVQSSTNSSHFAIMAWSTAGANGYFAQITSGADLFRGQSDDGVTNQLTYRVNSQGSIFITPKSTNAAISMNAPTGSLNSIVSQVNSVTNALFQFNESFTQFQSYATYGYLFKNGSGTNVFAIQADGTAIFNGTVSAGYQMTSPIYNVINGSSSTSLTSTATASRSVAIPDASGTLMIGSGTSGYHAKFTGSYSLGNSMLSDDGTTLTSAGATRSNMYLKAASSSYYSQLAFTNGSNSSYGGFSYNNASQYMQYEVNGSEWARMYSNGNLRVFSSSATDSGFRFQVQHSGAAIASLGTTSATGGYLQILYNTSSVNGYVGNGYQLISGGGTADMALTSDAGNILFGTSSGTERVRITNSDMKLNPQNLNFAMYLILNRNSGQDGGLLWQRNNAMDWQVINGSNGNFEWYSYGTNSTVLFIRKSDGLLFSTPTYNSTTGNGANVYIYPGGDFARSTSSLKYKKNVENYSRGLNELLQLRPVTYESKNEKEAGHKFAGLIAEEIHDLGLTEFVQYANDGTPDALAYGNMIALLTKAIQEQQTQIEQLKAQLN